MAKTPACPYGHYFNTEKLSVCPICGSLAVSAPEAKKDTGVPVPVSNIRSPSNQSQTVDIYSSVYTPVQPKPQPPRDETNFSSPPPTPPVSPSLQSAVNAVSSFNDAEDVRTIGILNSSAYDEPVVGWLICVKGKYFGQSFNLKTGNNAVGRAVDMDIHLAEEESISRHKHCIITFEPDKQEFFIQQGESSGLTYLNGEMVMLPVKMKSKDTIKVGKAEFLLIPLCIDGFRWEGYTHENQEQ